MARKQTPPPPASRQLGPEDLKLGIRLLERRLQDLRSFDVAQITEHFDPRADALKNKVNDSLAQIFGEGTIDYRRHSKWSLSSLPLIIGRHYSAHEAQRGVKEEIAAWITALESLLETLRERLEDQLGGHGTSEPRSAPSADPGRTVFIVHGHDDSAKLAAARFLEKLDLRPVILHEQPNQGKTIIEKLEGHTNVDFAIVLLTPDDMAHPVSDPTRKALRARQNVMFELGLFIGLLGRKRVCALYRGDVEIPPSGAGGPHSGPVCVGCG